MSQILGPFVEFKWTTILCFSTCILASLLCSKLEPVKYKWEMIVDSGVVSTARDGSIVYVDSSENLRALVESGIFTRSLATNAGISPERFGDIKMRAQSVPFDRYLNVSTEVLHEEDGKKILNQTFQLLEKHTQPLTKLYSEKLGMEIAETERSIQGKPESFLTTPEGIRQQDRIVGLKSHLANLQSLSQSQPPILVKSSKTSVLVYLVFGGALAFFSAYFLTSIRRSGSL